MIAHGHPRLSSLARTSAWVSTLAGTRPSLPSPPRPRACGLRLAVPSEGLRGGALVTTTVALLGSRTRLVARGPSRRPSLARTSARVSAHAGTRMSMSSPLRPRGRGLRLAVPSEGIRGGALVTTTVVLLSSDTRCVCPSTSLHFSVTREQAFLNRMRVLCFLVTQPGLLRTPCDARVHSRRPHVALRPLSEVTWRAISGHIRLSPDGCDLLGFSSPMARTKQTASRSTGEIAPRVRLRTSCRLLPPIFPHKNF